MNKPSIENSRDLMEFIGKQADRFQKLNTINAVDFAQECLFAKQQLMKNEYTFKAALANPASLQAAILNVAAIGISLNPALAHAYLVPRAPVSGQAPVICLDISYRGLVKLATDSNAIRDCKSVLVYEGDHFLWKGAYEMPEHHADPFDTERKKVKGAYNIARMDDGSVMIDVIDKAYIDKVQKTSRAQNGPWKTWWEEMVMKTATRHASKSWPPGDDRERFDKAIELFDQQDGIAYTLDEQAHYVSMLRDQRTLEFFLWNKQQPEEKIVALYNSFAEGHKTYDKGMADRAIESGREQAVAVYDEWADLLKANDADGAQQIRDEWSDGDWAQIVVAGDGEIPEASNG